jgi:hypothetical protein
MGFSGVIGTEGVQKIEALGEIGLHAASDSGVGDAQDACR